VTRPLSPECRLLFRTADLTCPPAELASFVAAVSDWERLMAMASVRWPPRTSPAYCTRWTAACLRRSWSRHVAGVDDRAADGSSYRDACSIVQPPGRARISFMLLKGAAVGAMIDPRSVHAR
jgi:hypothetical protein